MKTFVNNWIIFSNNNIDSNVSHYRNKNCSQKIVYHFNYVYMILPEGTEIVQLVKSFSEPSFGYACNLSIGESMAGGSLGFTGWSP